MIQKELSDYSSSDTECPTCGRTDFASKTGMRVHHANTHGESLVKVTLTCKNCGGEYEEEKGREDRSSYCSKECQNDHRSERFSGENHYNYNRVEIECDNCGETLQRPPSRVNPHDKQFCGESCKGEYKSEHAVGENHHNFTSELIECDYCDEEVYKAQYEMKNFENNFCSHDCQYKFMRETGLLAGEKNPAWSGGHSQDYGANWNQQREKRLEMDGWECVACGLSNEEHLEEWGKELEVHHIKRKESFRNEDGVLDYEAANRLHNLVSLCILCHKEWEGIPVRPQ